MFPLDALLGIGSKLIERFLPDPEQKAAAQLELLKMRQSGELAQLGADVSEGQELTKRLQADMASDSWLAKNIRPMALIAILGGYFVFAMMSAYGVDTNERYVELLGQWGIVVMSFYFGGRTMEKVMERKNAVK